eukprot:4630083-Prymnesium_polylepis.1
MGKSKVFMRGFVYAHLLRLRDWHRTQAVLRLQRWIQRKNAMRKAARARLRELLEEATIEQIERVLPICKRAQVGTELLELAARVVADLTAGAELQKLLGEALEQRKTKLLRTAVQRTFEWLQSGPTEVALRRMPWARAKDVEATLLRWEKQEIETNLKAATEAATENSSRVEELQTALDEANTWVTEQATEAGGDFDEVRRDIDEGQELLDRLTFRKRALLRLESVVNLGDGAESHRLEEVIESARAVGADEGMIAKAQGLKTARQVAERDSNLREARRKLEVEAEAERKGREARQGVIEARRDA